MKWLYFSIKKSTVKAEGNHLYSGAFYQYLFAHHLLTLRQNPHNPPALQNNHHIKAVNDHAD